MEKTTNHITADRPVSFQPDDRFQRYGFAKRIADAIKSRQNSEGIIIGVYGAWGEGKTSVINFIDNELANDPRTIRIKFNPWRYSDENTLLTHFFNVLARAFDKDLTTGKEKAGATILKYGKLLTVVGSHLGDAVDTLGSMLADVDVEELKDRIEKIIIESKKKLVIFIDDIDRLDKNEIYSVFRLVKLTADFINTTYLLSFDEKVVSAAIADRFGSHDSESGHNFLEKIIQVPLILPKARPEALTNYCVEKINEILNTYQIEISDDEQRRFGSVFTTYLANKFDTPRMVVRYTNSLSFSVPLLLGEVNVIDLMIIEAIKIIYPRIYNSIREDSGCFTQGYSYFNGENEEIKKQNAKNALTEMCKEYPLREAERIILMLQEVFPVLKEIYKNTSFPQRRYEEWHNDKRIASLSYINRYFSYCVIKGEISDVMFDKFIIKLSISSEEEILNDITKLIESSSAASFMRKIRGSEGDLSWRNSEKLIRVMSNHTDLFPVENKIHFFPSDSPGGQCCLFICKLISNHGIKSEQITLVMEILKNTPSLELAFEVLRKLNPLNKESSCIFSEQEFQDIWNCFFDRLITEAGEKDIFEHYENYEAFMLCKFWEQYNRKSFTEYMSKLLEENPRKSISLLRTYMPRFRAMGDDKYKEGDLDEKTFLYIKSILDCELILSALLKLYSKKDMEIIEVEWHGKHVEQIPDFDVAKQFYHWYKVEN